MSLNTAPGCSICGVYHPSSPTCPNVSLAYMRGQQPHSTVSALDALRSAVVTQTALLRELSQQVRLFEGNTAKAFELTATNFAALAERLDKLERQNLAFDARWSSIDRHGVLVLGHIGAIEAKLLAQTTQSIAANLPTHREIRNALARKKITRKDSRRRGKAKR